VLVKVTRRMENVVGWGYNTRVVKRNTFRVIVDKLGKKKETTS